MQKVGQTTFFAFGKTMQLWMSYELLSLFKIICPYVTFTNSYRDIDSSVNNNMEWKNKVLYYISRDIILVRMSREYHVILERVVILHEH